MTALLDDARTHLRSGNLSGAEGVLRQILAIDPAHGEALELLGASLGAQGRHADAIPWLDAALRLKPAAPSLLYNRAIALLSLGRSTEASADLQRAVEERSNFAAAWTALGRARAMLGDLVGAEQAFRQPLVLDPASVEALYNLSSFLHASGRIDEAIAGYRKALLRNPALAPAHTNLGNALRVKGLAAEALVHYAEAARLAPNLIEALSNYAVALQQAGRHAEAAPLLERAQRINPRSAALASNLGVSYYHLNRFADAQACQELAIQLDPHLDEARVNLGNAMAAQGLNEEALAIYKQVAQANPANADAQSNLGLTMQELGDVEGAIAAYERALAVRPDHPDALNNMGFLLQEEGRRREAIAYYQRALAINPLLARAEYNLGLVQLAEREWTEGWRHAEARFAVIPPIAVPRAFSIPRLGIADMGRARKVAVWSEQGIGDQLLYATMLPDLERRGVEFILEIDPRAIPAIKRLHDWDVVARDEKAFAPCDYHLPLGSLGSLLRTDDRSFEGQPNALLAADPARVEATRKNLHVSDRRLIGISWRSFQPKTRGFLQRRKSASLDEYHVLSRRDDLALLDLQYGDTQAERDAFEARGGRLLRVPELDLFNDIDGVLAAIEACDLVITTSNVTAHFAGALGKETWLLYLAGVPPFHYWATDDRGHCLWYPSLRVVTAPDLRTWPMLFERVARALA